MLHELSRLLPSLPSNAEPAVCMAAAESVANFLKSSSHNLRYMGIDSLACIVRRDAAFANEHQMAVIACLEDPDETLKAKTLQLLHKMTKPGNVEVSLMSLRELSLDEQCCMCLCRMVMYVDSVLVTAVPSWPYQGYPNVAST